MSCGHELNFILPNGTLEALYTCSYCLARKLPFVISPRKTVFVPLASASSFVIRIRCSLNGGVFKKGCRLTPNAATTCLSYPENCGLFNCRLQMCAQQENTLYKNIEICIVSDSSQSSVLYKYLDKLLERTHTHQHTILWLSPWSD